MNPTEFSNDGAGRLVKVLEGHWAFVPNRVPRVIDLRHPIPLLIEQSSRDLGRLSERAEQLPNPDLLIEPLIRKEAQLSSQIEGTIASQEELALSETPGLEKSMRPEVLEVRNYVEAVKYGIKELGKLPICLRLIRDLHERLMRGVRGDDQRPGEFRTIQNHIGTPGQAITEARYVPPPVPDMLRCLDDFERDLHELVFSGLPQLVQAALIHYQFEAIHPFRDGNGRIGRMLIPLFLAERGLLPYPLLHLSAYFEEHRAEYSDQLLRVSQTGDYVRWTEFFLMGLSREANRSLILCWDLMVLRNKYLTGLQKKRASSLLPRMVDFLFRAPVMTVPIAAQICNVTYAAAKANVLKLQDAKILVPIPGIKSLKVWKASEIIQLLSR
jgi:Fic family protein